MKAHLRIQLPPVQALGNATAVDWVRMQGTQCQAHGRDSLAVLGARHPGTPVLACLDVQDLILLDVALPPLSGRRLQAALRGEVETLLLDDLQDVAFGHGPRGSDGVVPVAWLGSAALEQVLEVLAACQLPVRALYPTPMLLPWADGQATVCGSTEHLLVRTGRDRGMAQWRTPGDPARALEALGTRLAAAGIHTVQWIEHIPAGWPLAVPATMLPSHQRLCGALPGWSLPLPSAPRVFPRRALGLGLAALLLLGLGLQLQALQWRGKGQALQEQMQQQMQAQFPEVTEVIDPVLQARRALAAPSAPVAAAEVQQLVAATLQAAPELGGQVRVLHYQPGQLTLDLDAPAQALLDDAQQRERWQQALQAQGLQMAVAGGEGLRITRGSAP